MDKKDRISKFKTIVAERTKSEVRILDESDQKDGSAVFQVPRFSRADRRVQRNHFGPRKGSMVNTSADTSAEDGFSADVRFSDPILKVTSSSKDVPWRKDLPGNIATGLLLISFASVFCMMINEPVITAFATPALIVFTVLAMLESSDRISIKYVACAVIAALLLAAAVIFHSSIGSGFAYMMDEFYDIAEEAQAYIYDRFPGGFGASEWDCRITMMWGSSMMGMLMALVPARLRRAACMLLTAAVMLALAYYGLLPETLCAGAMIMALLLTLSKENIFAAMPLMLITVILFGAIMLIDPGENYSISRMDENVRDRIAFRSALIEREDPTIQENMDPESLTDPETEADRESVMGNKGSYILIGMGFLLAVAIGAVTYLLIKRFKRRQAAVRKGIDSTDPREAVTAMFPYSVRWLKASGIETHEAPFAEMADDISRVYESAYAGRFSEMYSLWREAAYSDHDISEADRAEMDRFTRETISLVSGNRNTLQRLRMKYKHAL